MKELTANIYAPHGKNAKNLILEDIKLLTRLEDGQQVLFQQWPRKRGGKTLPITKFIIHETGGLDQIHRTEKSLLKNGTGVHFCIDVLGNIFAYNDCKYAVAHENFTNDIAIGLEILHCNYKYRKDFGLNGFEKKFYNTLGDNEVEKFINAAVGREVLVGDECPWSLWKEKDQNITFVVPTKMTLEATYKLTKNICILYNIPIVFPGVDNNTKEFIWGRVLECKVLPGINAHHRVEHSDGLFEEHYIICRFNDYTVDEAYEETIKATKSLKGSKSRRTKIPRK
jgi:hypothetical protein